MRPLSFALLAGLLVGSLLGVGGTSLGCCDSSCSPCPMAFCKETPQIAVSKAHLPALVPVNTVPLFQPSGGFFVQPVELSASASDFRGFSPPLRN